MFDRVGFSNRTRGWSRSANSTLTILLWCVQGSRSDKEYLYLDDMLTKQLITLDGIDTAGREEIRQLRKDSIAFVNSCLSQLDEKATEHVAAQQQQLAKEQSS